MEPSQVLKTFLDYVQISSESRSEKAFAERVADDLRSLGLRVETDHAAEKAHANTGNVYAFLEGNPSFKPILFSAHLDTVPPGKNIRPVVEQGVIRSAGNTVLGADDKSGVAAIVEALRLIVSQKIPHRPIEVAFTISEEVGLLGAKYLDYTRFQSRQAVVFDNEGDVGTIVNQAPGHMEISATKETTANIGTFLAEGPNNIVPETVRLSAEIRSLDPQKLRGQCNQIIRSLQNACQKYSAALQYAIETTYDSYHIPENDPLILLLRDCCKNLDLPVSICSTGGGSDANIFNANGIHSVVVGTGMEKIHGSSEYITVQNLENTEKLALELMKAQ